MTACALALGGCAFWRGAAPVFTTLDAPRADAVLAGIPRGTNGVGVTKFAMNIAADMPGIHDIDVGTGIERSDAAQSVRAKAVCLWQPGAALRMRISRLGFPVFDVLHTGGTWYLIDEMKGQAYVCDRVDHLRSVRIPAYFFAELQRLPGGWWPSTLSGATVKEADGMYRIEERSRSRRRTVSFAKDAVLPDNISIEDVNGNVILVTISRVTTNVAVAAAAFTPALDGYEVVDLRGTQADIDDL